ncbi:hypothetical protein A3J77_00920 [Candidatus Wolfebacteria bacterium RBG_13_41_7]|uniref:Uncharacterized protein n=1 Tax=Candidatus Wolfebacteria bacterium RBG_13_41_7 TaxID=1802554 RepID=A0A1F8DQU6_9BACT|nr:MAG: hypothetical protein A3J77_00920 [Candidatus Wolfebacteria bacterium RBG_13_41_7]
MKNKQELIFTATSIFLILFLAGFIFYSINFLFDKTTEALSQNISQTQKDAKFNLDGFKKLGIIQ